MLTLQKLQDLPKHEIFNRGEEYHFKWVAVTGEIGDWTIYYGRDYNSEDEIKRFGNKFLAEEKIRNLVPCDDEAFDMYRY